MKYAIWETRDYTKRLDEYGEVYRAAIPSYICSNCKCAVNKKSDVCPNCDAIMVGGITSDSCIIDYDTNAEE